MGTRCRGCGSAMVCARPRGGGHTVQRGIGWNMTTMSKSRPNVSDIPYNIDGFSEIFVRVVHALRNLNLLPTIVDEFIHFID